MAKSKANDLTGIKSGRLTVLSRASDRISPSNKHRVYWNCVCECGTELEVRSDGLSSGRTKSCGCLKDEVAREQIKKAQASGYKKPHEDLTGKVFGRLTVIEKAERAITPKGRELIRWICSCTCGNTFNASHEALKYGDSLTCGCVPPEFADSEFKNKSEIFAFKAKQVHGDKYNYSLVDYKRSTSNVTIICSEHGGFKQIPTNHLTGNGCPRCAAEGRSNNLETFIEKSKALHSGVYDYSKVDFVSPIEPVTITCKIHGDFEEKPKHHLVGAGCPECRKEATLKKRQKEFIRRSVEKHGDRYDYSKVVYQDVRIHVRIGCPTHGEFLQKPDIHMLGSKCPKCSSEERAAKQHWDYLERCKLDSKLANSDAVLYLLKLSDECETFLKVGISSSFKRRLSHYKEEGLDFEILEVVNTTAIQAALLEREALKYIREFNIRYIPDKVFAGWTECATLESKDQLLEIFKEFISNDRKSNSLASVKISEGLPC